MAAASDEAAGGQRATPRQAGDTGAACGVAAPGATGYDPALPLDYPVLRPALPPGRGYAVACYREAVSRVAPADPDHGGADQRTRTRLRSMGGVAPLRDRSYCGCPE